MMKKMLLWIAALAALVAYLGWVIEDGVTLFVLALSLLSIIVPVLIVAACVGVASLIVWRFLRPAQREFYRSHRPRFVFIELVAMGFFVVVAFLLNRYALPHRFHPMSLVVDALVALFALLLLWTLLSPTRRKLMMAVPVTGAFLIVTFLVTALAPSADTGGGGGVDKLTSLGYLTWVPAEGGAENSGVIYHDSTRAYHGVNIYGPRNAARAYLMDMDGGILHTWERYIETNDTWNHIEVYPNGDLLALVRQELLLCLDWDSNIKWVRQLRCHHDIATTEDGGAYALTRSERVVRCHGFPLPILDDRVTILAPDGSTVEEFWLYDVLGEIVPASRVWRAYRAMLNPRAVQWITRTRRLTDHWIEASMVNDVFHTNTLEIIDRDVDDVFRRGNLIVCSRTQNTVAVIDPRTKELLWSWGRGRLEWPHHPTLLDNGNLLIFDNGSRRKWSRIVELDPRDKRIVWEYRAEEPGNFFSYTRGGNQRLPNGNTLITNSDSGHAFEVTHDGEIVWEFLNPETNDSGDKRAAIYRLMRLVDATEYPFLERLGD